MASWLDRLTAGIARIHAHRVYRRFRRVLDDPRRAQHASLTRALDTVRGSAYARHLDLQSVHTPADLRSAVPLQTYEDVRPWIDRLAAGDTAAWLAPRRRLHMFATTSGTTSRPKWIPVTDWYVQDYRCGWNAFGLKMLEDHPDAILRPILQSTSRDDADRAPSGVPVGAITGLMARLQKGIVRRYYVGSPGIAAIADAEARFYALMRFAVVRDVAFAITANPSTLIQLARIADLHAECLIRDVRDGALRGPAESAAGAGRLPRVSPDPVRARELEQIRERLGTLRPRDYWRMSFLACWTGGSMGPYLSRAREWYGPLPIRDIGLLASEGRVSTPLQDDVPWGPLALHSGYFEFIPLANAEQPQPATIEAADLSVGERYAVVLSNSTGLLRYRLDDVVEVKSFLGRTPVIEFLYRAGRVCSVAGEKLTESQVVAAWRATCESVKLAESDFIVAPVWGDPPWYQLVTEVSLPADFCSHFDRALAAQNEEYESRRKSLRLGALAWRQVPPGTFAAMDRSMALHRGGNAEQYKRSILLTAVEELERVLPRDSVVLPGGRV